MEVWPSSHTFTESNLAEHHKAWFGWPGDCHLMLSGGDPESYVNSDPDAVDIMDLVDGSGLETLSLG